MMVRWLAFLLWLFSYSIWKTFFVSLCWKPSVDVADDGVGVQVLSGSDNGLRSDEEEADASADHRSKLSDHLADVLSKISLNEKVLIHFEVNEYGYRPLTCDEDAQVKEILGALATTTIVKELVFYRIWPMSWEGVCESLVSNQSVKKLEILDSKERVFELDRNSWFLHLDRHSMVLELMSRVLLENTYLEDVDLQSETMGDKCAVLLSNVLRHNRTLKRLDVGWCEMDEEGWKVFLDPLSRGDDHNSDLEHLGLKVRSSPESHCDVHIGNMVRRNSSLVSLKIQGLGDVGTSVISSIGEALHFNRQLSTLVIAANWVANVVWKGLFSSLTPDAHGQQANTSLRELFLYNADINEDDVEIDHDSLCDMLRGNTSLIKILYWSEDDTRLIQLLESLKSNKCLEILDLTDCDGVTGRRVLGAIMDLLDENHYLKEIILDDTPFQRDGSAEVVMAALDKKAKDRLWEVVQGMATTIPTSGRVFMCGEPYAGKTTLRKTIMKNYSSAIVKRSIKTRVKALFKGRKRDGRVPSAKDTLEERTRGIEVHNFQCEDIAMTIWDMAGQEEYHAFHDLVVPNLPMSGSCCSFVLVCNLAYRHDKPHELKGIEEIIVELQYWLKFIVSNTRISNLYRPHVMIVFTHMDECSWDTRFLIQATKDLKGKFEEFLEFEDVDFVINAKTFKDSVDGVFKAMVNHLKGLLARVPKTIEACDKLQEVIVKRIEDNPHELMLEWDRFSEICDEVQELQMVDASDPKLIKRRKEFVASSLHDRGHVIYHEDLNMVILNPHLFCHGIMGELMNGEKMSRYKSNVQHGITKGNLQMALSSTPIAKQHEVALEDVLQVMKKMELYYEQEDETIMIPSILSDGYGNLTWPMETKASISYRYIGRRLTIDDKEKTLLSLGFFPRLQVSLQKEFGRACEIMKNMIKFIHNGMETIIEYSGSPTFDIDILMRSNGKEDMIMLDSLQRHLIKRIVTLCAHPTLGCPGVKLVDHIMRPACAVELVAYKYRSEHQVVMVEKLKQMVLDCANLALKYDWRSEGAILKMGCDDAKTLLGEQMSNDVLNQLMIDLKSIECRISGDKGSMDVIGNARSMGVTKAPKPSHVTMDDLWIKMDKLEDTMNQRFDRLEEKMQEIKLLQDKLLPRVCKRLEELVTFTVEFQQHKYPRLPYFTDCQHCGFTRIVPGMRKYVLHLLCEHKDGFHIVEDQEGCELSIGNESTQAFQNVVKWGLRVLTLLLKVGAHVGAGMGSMVPDLGKDFLLVLDTPGIGLDEVNFDITRTLMDEAKPHVSRTKEKVAEQWLIDVLKEKCKGSNDIKRVFKLQKVMYKDEDGEGGCVAWICNKHYEEGRQSSTLELLPSDMDG